MFKRIKIRTNILLHFLFVLVTLASTLIGTQYYFNKKIATEAIERTFHQTAHKVATTLQDKDHLSKEILYQIESHPDIEKVFSETLPLDTIRHFIHTLARYKNMYAIYLGFPNGDFFEVVNMKISKTIHEHYKAPEQTRWSIIKIYNSEGKRIREFIFLDNTLHILGKRHETSDYYVTKRDWYIEAVHAEKPVRSDPYLFSNLQEKGITYSKKLQGKSTVLALDFTLKSMHDMLRAIHFSQSGHIYLYGRDASLINTSETAQSDTAVLLQQIITNKEIDTIKTLQTKNTSLYAMVTPLSEEMGRETYVGITIDQNEMLSPYREKIYYSLAIAFVLLLMFIPLVLYLTDHIIRPIKALMQENEMIKQRKFDHVKPIETNIVEFIELSNSQISMSESIQNYQKQLEDLLDSFIKLIADAIDAKSAYTGSHCKKVPVIAGMLAEQAAQSDNEAFKNFCFADEDEKETFERAAWLHDCGKITTPEYVVDKATKLETIYNRIHEIRTRFEVLWRDAEIDYYKALLRGEEKVKCIVQKEEMRRQLLEEFNFVSACNVGSEYMDEADIERLKKISERTWLRHFDDRAGLSEEELSRYHTAPLPLPVTERLLDDKQQHLIERNGFDREAYEREGFTLQVPEYLYNRGELYNLSIQKGTLTEEERYKINEHVIMTIKMLERLPFPENMAQIPKIAGEHHETMDGKGYPRFLTQEQLSIPSRIMAIADIFEALTASDRPYKKAKTLSEALKIMYTMKKEKHIDANLFDLFITSKVYLAYVQAYLKPEQIDTVDEESLLG